MLSHRDLIITSIQMIYHIVHAARLGRRIPGVVPHATRMTRTRLFVLLPDRLISDDILILSTMTITTVAHTIEQDNKHRLARRYLLLYTSSKLFPHPQEAGLACRLPLRCDLPRGTIRSVEHGMMTCLQRTKSNKTRSRYVHTS